MLHPGQLPPFGSPLVTTYLDIVGGRCFELVQRIKGFVCQRKGQVGQGLKKKLNFCQRQTDCNGGPYTKHVRISDGGLLAFQMVLFWRVYKR